MKRLLFGGVFITFALSGTQVQGAELPDVASVRQHVNDATGTPPKMERTTFSYDAFGLHGAQTTFRSGEDTRENINFGPFATARGTFRGQAWHQNANGQTVLDRPDPGLAIRESETTTIGPIATPVNGYVIATMNKRGQGTKEYIDSTSWHVVRRDVTTATATTTYAYDDFRTVGGYTRPWHWTARDGHPENDAEDRIDRDDAGPVTEADVQIPPSRRNLVEFPAGKTSVALPVREEADQFVVRVNIGSRGLDLGLDTGASSIVLDDSIVNELGLKTYGTLSNAANAGRYKSTSAIVPEMNVGELTLHDVVVRTIPHLNADRPGEYKLVGLLGFDFIASLVLKLDYERGQVTALEPGAFFPPSDPLTSALDVRLGSGQPMTDVTVNGALGERFVIDTGGGGAVLIFDYFARRHPEALIDESGGRLQDARNIGAGGSFETRRYRLGSVRVGKVVFKNFVADAVTSSTSYGGNNDGLIGSQFLKLYTLYTDYGKSMLYLVPNALGRSGIERSR